MLENTHFMDESPSCKVCHCSAGQTFYHWSL